MSINESDKQDLKLSTSINSSLILRQSLADNVDHILSVISGYKEHSKNGSEDLFGDFGEEDSIKIKKTTNYSELDVLIKEKNFLGLYVSKNPIADFTPFLQFIKNLADKEDIYLVLVNKVRKIYTRNKDMMFAIDVSVDGVNCEGIVFPKNANKMAQVLQEATLFWVRGKISSPRKKTIEKKLTVEQELELGEGVDEIREYEELPKLIFENACVFEEGVVNLYNDEGSSISFDRQKVVAKIDFSKVYKNPLDYKEITQDIFGEKVVVTKIILLRLGLETSTVLKIKDVLLSKDLKVSGDDALEVVIEMEYELGKFKTAKNKYYIHREVYDEIVSLIG